MILVESQTEDLSKCLKAAIKQYKKEDDVFRQEFQEGIILVCKEPKNLQIDANASKCLKDLGCSWYEVIAPNLIKSSEDPRRSFIGPVILQHNEIYEAWRIFDDFNHAFLVSTWPSLTQSE